HDVAVRAYARAGDPAWYPNQLAPEHGGTGPTEADGGLAPWAPLKLYEGDPGIGTAGHVRAHGGDRRDELLVGAGGRDPGGARGGAGTDGEDARAGPVD